MNTEMTFKEKCIGVLLWCLFAAALGVVVHNSEYRATILRVSFTGCIVLVGAVKFINWLRRGRS